MLTRSRARFLAALFALVGVLCSPLRAGSDQSLVVDGVTIRVRSPWPDMVTHGAVPLLFDATNGGAERRGVELVLRSRGFGASAATASTRIELEPGASTAFELFVPAQARIASQYQMTVTTSTGESNTLVGVGSTEQPAALRRNVLVIAARAPVSGEPVRWTSALSTEAEPRNATLATDAGDFGAVPVFTGPGGTPVTMEHVVATAIVHADLPTRPEGYTSLDAVVVDARDGWPRPECVAPLAEWTRTGGILMVAGRGAEALARGSADFGPWMEERFLVGELSDVRVWNCAQGILIVSSVDEPLSTSAEVAILNAQLEGNGANAGRVSWIPQPLADRAEFGVVALGGLELPYRALMAVLVLFAILIGPVNFWYVKRAKKPALLLVTVPALAIAFSLALFGYGALSQGLDARTARATYTLLDQRSHRSSSVELREFFVGLAADDGLRPGPGASVWNALEVEWKRMPSRTSETLTFGSSLSLSGAYLPVRTPTKQTVIVDRAARVRLDVRREGAGWVVQNGLGTRIEAFVVRVASGELWSANGPVEAGGRASLSPVAGTSLSGVSEAVFPRFAIGTSDGLPIGTYAARIAACPFGDDLGVPMREVSGDHQLVGVLDLEEVR